MNARFSALHGASGIRELDLYGRAPTSGDSQQQAKPEAATALPSSVCFHFASTVMSGAGWKKERLGGDHIINRSHKFRDLPPLPNGYQRPGLCSLCQTSYKTSNCCNVKVLHHIKRRTC